MEEQHSANFKFGQWLSTPPPGEEVVISGMSGRFPKSNNIKEFRDNLYIKENMISDIDKRWTVKHREIPTKGGLIPDVSQFDPGFFGVHYRQALNMDPILRNFLEVATEAIIDAGINPLELQGNKTGVFVGYAWSDIDVLTMRQIDQRQSFGITGNLRNTLAHRISYFFKLNGPSMILDTACSSSLTAVDQAFKAIRSGQCNSAIVGGCNLILHPGCTLQFARLGVLSTQGLCKVFDEDAEGYVRSDTIACVFLQKSKHSKRIYAQIIHTKSNSDGFKPEGISYPSSQMQAHLLQELHRECGIDPNNLYYAELHGTATKVGDIPETQAVDIAIAIKRKNPLWIGSIKSNMGHSEPASGIASLIKILISFENEQIPPNLHFTKAKSGMTALEEGRLKIVTDVIPINKENPFISINNFGFGGSNCHVILKRIAEKKKMNDSDIPKLVCVSGRTEESVKILLNQVKENSFDSEYIGLIHQVFRKKIPNHPFRGYIVVSKDKELKTSFGLVKNSLKKSPCYINFGQFKNSYKSIQQYFLKYPVFQNTIERIQNIVLNYDLKNVKKSVQNLLERVAVQIGIAETLKTLEIESICIWEDDIGKLVCAYFDEALTIEEIIHNIIYQKMHFKDSLELKNPKINRFEKYLTKTSFDSCEKENSIPPNSILIDISDSNKAVSEDPITFLEIIGSLFQQGYNPQIQKLYPEIKFPVSRNTAMISPFINWHHNKIWYNTIFSNISVELVVNKTSISLPDHKYLEGHVIDGRILFPATGYLNVVWELIAKDRLIKPEYLPIVFEDVRFLRATTLSNTRFATFTLSLKKTGIFEIVENGSIVVTGRVFIPDKLSQRDFLKQEVTKETEILDESDIYKELNLRGYNYSGFFKGIAKCDIEATTGLIRWENNWISFMDKIFQMRILQFDSRLLYVPTFIKKISIDPIRHLEEIENLDNKETFLSVYCNKECDTITSGGIEVSGLQATVISKRKPKLEPVLEKNVFIANITSLDLVTSIRVITQIILEESLESNFKALEILDEFTKPDTSNLMPLVFNALEDIPIVNPNLTISTKDKIEDTPGIKFEAVPLSSSSNLLLVIASKLFQRPTFLNQALNALNVNGFALSRENKDFVPPSLEGITILTQYTAENEKLILFRKAVIKIDKMFLEISSENFNWIQELQKVMEKETEVVLYSQNQDIDGILGLVNCIRKEPGGKKISCFFIRSEAPKFDPENYFYKKQVCKNQAFNVYKNSQWGTYRHLRLENLEENLREHSFVFVQSKGNFSSLKWVEGPLSSNNKNIIYTYYCALNFKDIMLTSGRIFLETKRLNQENIVGFEYSGRDSRGKRVMGIISGGALSTLISPDFTLLWPIPDHWTLKDAATVPAVYCTLIYGLLIRNSLTPNTSILIHSAAGGIGIAALNIATFYKCKIFVTVGTKEKRSYIQKHFPEISENHIGNSRDSTFEEMIKRETKGRGVDIVINSLTEEKLEASIRCLARGGNLVEIGKFDLLNNKPLNLLLLEKEISYHGIMADRVFSETEGLKLMLCEKLLEGIKEGFVKPLPTNVFKHNEVEAAFKFMATGKHIGKILIQIREEDELKLTDKNIKSLPKFFADSEKCYIILGGLGGFGLELADWLILRGARNVVLTSRNGICTGYQTQRIKTWKSYGATIHISTINILSKRDCINLITEAKRFGEIAGVFNLAVVLEDALLEDQTSEKFNISLKPKAFATKFLDEVTRELCPDLEYFVVFSSVSCGRGNIGQTNYGMANSIMERICEKRKKDGLPALAIQWGAVGDVGLVAKMQKNNKELVIGGTLQQKISSCLSVLDILLKQNYPVVSSMVVAEKIDKNLGSGSAVDAVANILGIKDIKTVSPNISFGEIGLDSIMGAEIIQTLEKDFEICVAPKEVRNLTFTKLMEMEREKNSISDKSLKKIAQAANNIVQYLPNSTSDKEKLLRLESKLNPETNAKTIFVLPGVESIFTLIERFTKKLNAHVFGIQYSYKNPENSILEMAENIFVNIEPKLSKDQQFYLVAYSFGVIVALELVSLLEEKGYIGKIVAIDGSPYYSKAALMQYASGKTDSELETLFLHIVFPMLLPPHILAKNQEKMLKCPTLDDKINFAITLIPNTLPEENKVEKQALTALHKRFKSVRDYKFCSQKLNSVVHLCKPEQPIIDNMEHDYQLSEFCNKKVEVLVLKGNHLTILEQDELALSVSKIFNLEI